MTLRSKCRLLASTTTLLLCHAFAPGLSLFRTSALWSSTLSTVDLTIFPHRPLGCTVEESLADASIVFVSKVVPGGKADAAGIQVGDVVVGLPDVFGNLQNVEGMSLEQVKGLVASCPEEQPLSVQLKRGTSALEDHETALVAICSDPMALTESDECVLDYLKGGYQIDEDEPVEVAEDASELLDNLHGLWADELPVATPSVAPEATEASSSNKPKPWSSRSSPSGTFVRDPKTGEMRNIDA